MESNCKWSSPRPPRSRRWSAERTHLGSICSRVIYKTFLIFLHNDFVQGKFTVEGNQISPDDIKLPIFAVSTEEDHVAPWRSVHKIHLITPCEDITFVLTSGGHNAGIVSEPGHPGRSYHIHTMTHGQPYRSPEGWLDSAQKREGSWWLAWHDWLSHRSDKKKTEPPVLSEGLCAAPGTYVLQK